jgi:hypothetical protein
VNAGSPVSAPVVAWLVTAEKSGVITDDVSDARVYGGIHFRYDQDAGDRMGERIGHFKDSHRLVPVDARAEN